MIKYIILSVFITVSFIEVTNGGPVQPSFITGVGTSHFEAHRMAVNAANATGMSIRQQISRKSEDGLWHVIIKVTPK